MKLLKLHKLLHYRVFSDDAGKMKKSRSAARLSKSPSVARLAAHVPRVARLAQREKPPEKMTPEQIWQEAMQKSQQPIAPELVRLSANAAKVEERQMPLFVELARFIEQKYLDQYEAEQAADQAASEAAQRAAEAERARKQAEAEGKTVDEKDGKDDGKGSGAKAIAPSAPQRRAIRRSPPRPRLSPPPLPLRPLPPPARPRPSPPSGAATSRWLSIRAR